MAYYCMNCQTPAGPGHICLIQPLSEEAKELLLKAFKESSRSTQNLPKDEFSSEKSGKDTNNKE